MKLCLMTDSLGDMPFEKMIDSAAKLGYQSLELATGNWSKAPHLDLDRLLNSEVARAEFVDYITSKGLTIEALNCSGNQLAPNDEGKAHQLVVEKTFRLAELLGVTKIVMMSGLPGGSPSDTTANWITTSWPPSATKILDWQWNEIAFPYWTITVEQAKQFGIKKIALENHGSQLVYNPNTLLKLRNCVGELVGMNLDPSHLFWMGGDPIFAVRALGDAIHHVHAKDTRIERGLADREGTIETRTPEQIVERTWNYVALGNGHDARWWTEFFSILKLVGYEGAVSVENEDLTMDSLTALKKSTNVLKDVMPVDFE